MQLGVVGVNPRILGTSVQSRRKVAEHLVAAGDQSEELPHTIESVGAEPVRLR